MLCLDCHSETQIEGGFHRKLDEDQVTLYRDDWIIQVAKMRASNVERLPATSEENQHINLEIATSIAEIYREREEYELLASHYLVIGNDELRDKYIELAIQQGMDDEGIIYFRSEQNRLDLIPQEVIDRRTAALKKRRDWFSLGRLHRQLEEYQLSVQATCKGIAEHLKKGRTFTAAIYLKEMAEEGMIDFLFVDALHEAEEEGDLWWQYRCLQELERDEEAEAFLLEHRKEIEELEIEAFNEPLAIALNDKKRYIELRKEEARSISAKPDPEEQIKDSTP